MFGTNVWFHSGPYFFDFYTWHGPTNNMRYVHFLNIWLEIQFSLFGLVNNKLQGIHLGLLNHGWTDLGRWKKYSIFSSESLLEIKITFNKTKDIHEFYSMYVSIYSPLVCQYIIASGPLALQSKLCSDSPELQL